MSDAKVRGIVHFIDDTKTYGKKGFRKRMVVLEQENERFTNYIPVEFLHEGCDSVDDLNVGDDVEIEYRLAGRKWRKDAASEEKYFLNAEATGFKVLGPKSAAAGGSTTDDANRRLAEAGEEDDDIPF